MLQAPPSAVVLFNSEDVDNWRQRDGSPATWAIADGAMTTCDADILTEEEFTDFMLHLQFMTPDMPGSHWSGEKEIVGCSCRVGTKFRC